MPKEPKPAALVGLVFELGVVVAVVFFGFLQLGAMVDERWQTDPWGVIVAVVAAFAATGSWLYFRLRSYL